jgi:hypothetical protein
MAFANEREEGVRYLRNLPGDTRALQGSLDSARQAGLCEPLLRQGANVADVLAVFQSPDYRNRIAVFHYGGHANGYELLLDGGERLHGRGFAAFLGQQRGLQLVFLNGCATEAHARRLLEVGVPAVIATAQAVDDAVATAFASHFYRALASGASIEAGFREAEASVLAARGESPRALYWGGAETVADHLPWALHVRQGAEAVRDWSLP